MSGRFQFNTEKGDSLTFVWDGAAISDNGEIILIEEEISKPVDLHIQGHVSRAAMMLSRGFRIRKLVWVTRAEEFRSLYRIVESWRQVMMEDFGAPTPPCDYLDSEGTLMATSEMNR
tara:strand:- start:75 stop:425 length:351 start_codon:yes stop_codon:yes gene_type:complete